jgi:lipopolysaccharide transport system ATP-binding protein
MVTRFCDEALWIDNGQVRMQGEPQRVVDAYVLDVTTTEQAQAARQHGVARDAEFVSIHLLTRDGQPATTIDSGDPLIVRARVRPLAPGARITIGLAILGADGVRCYSTTSAIDGLPPLTVRGEGTVECVIDRLDLTAGAYTLALSVGGVDDDSPAYAHRHTFNVNASSADTGVYRPPHSWRVSGDVQVDTGQR